MHYTFFVSNQSLWTMCRMKPKLLKFVKKVGTGRILDFAHCCSDLVLQQEVLCFARLAVFLFEPDYSYLRVLSLLRAVCRRLIF